MPRLNTLSFKPLHLTENSPLSQWTPAQSHNSPFAALLWPPPFHHPIVASHQSSQAINRRKPSIVASHRHLHLNGPRLGCHALGAMPWVPRLGCHAPTRLGCHAPRLPCTARL